MDFIEGLSKFEGKDVILVVVDRLTKFAHFISLTHPFTTQEVARVFLDTVAKVRWIPKSIVSDRDKVFYKLFLARAIQEPRVRVSNVNNMSPGDRWADQEG